MSKKNKEEEILEKTDDLCEQDVSETAEEENETVSVQEKSAEEELNEKLAAAEDKYLRLYAEFDNFRKRTIKEKEAIYANSVSDTVTALLPVIDSLERAISAGGDIEALKKGMEMVMKQVQDSLSAIRVEEIDTSSGFDPNVHNAVMHIEDETIEPQTIVEVFQKGYKIGDKIIRHAMVKVAN